MDFTINPYLFEDLHASITFRARLILARFTESVFPVLSPVIYAGPFLCTLANVQSGPLLPSAWPVLCGVCFSVSKSISYLSKKKKVHSGFSIIRYGKTQLKFLATPIYKSME